MVIDDRSLSIKGSGKIDCYYRKTSMDCRLLSMNFKAINVPENTKVQ